MNNKNNGIKISNNIITLDLDKLFGKNSGFELVDVRTSNVSLIDYINACNNTKKKNKKKYRRY